MDLSTNRTLTICNLAIFIILLLLLLHVLGYLEIRIKKREGMSSADKTTSTVVMWLSIVIGILYMLATVFLGDKR
jgi:uncharacterized membrane protein YidH (DUF202 family)